MQLITVSRVLAVVALIFGVLALATASLFGLNPAQEAAVAIIALAVAVLL